MHINLFRSFVLFRHVRVRQLSFHCLVELVRRHVVMAESAFVSLCMFLASLAVVTSAGLRVVTTRAVTLLFCTPWAFMSEGAFVPTFTRPFLPEVADLLRIFVLLT